MDNPTPAPEALAKELLALAEKATPGPWFSPHADGVVFAREKTGEHTARIITVCRDASVDSTAFIAFCRNNAEAIARAITQPGLHVIAREAKQIADNLADSAFPKVSAIQDAIFFLNTISDRLDVANDQRLASENAALKAQERRAMPNALMSVKEILNAEGRIATPAAFRARAQLVKEIGPVPPEDIAQHLVLAAETIERLSSQVPDGDGLSPEDRVGMFFDWCALHGFGLAGWPKDAAKELVAHFRCALVPQGRCETTLTERIAYPDCACGTYPENLGPCKTFEAGASGRCVYCDHGKACHDALTQPPPAAGVVSSASASSAIRRLKRRSSAQNAHSRLPSRPPRRKPRGQRTAGTRCAVVGIRRRPLAMMFGSARKGVAVMPQPPPKPHGMPSFDPKEIGMTLEPDEKTIRECAEIDRRHLRAEFLLNSGLLAARTGGAE